MNDKDKEAFERWFLDNYKYKYTELVILEAIEQHRTAWQAACEYKQKEIDELKNKEIWQINQDGTLTRNISIAEIEKLQAENAKLRECVQFYAENKKYHGYSSNKSGEYEYYHGDIIDDSGKRARQVLKELDKEQK